MHTTYGTTNGFKYNLTTTEYDRLIADSELTSDIIDHFRKKANAKIDLWLSKVIDVTNLPLTTIPDDLHGVSDDMMTFYFLRTKHHKVDPGKSDWVDDFWERALENLKTLIENPASIVDATGATLIVNNFECSTDGYDPVFGMSRTKDGETITTEYEESMDGWNDAYNAEGD